jgi:transposase
VSRSTKEIVAEIKSVYARTTADKLLIQKDMVELRNEPHNWVERQIAEKTGIPQSTVNRWLQAYDEGVTQVGQASRLTPESMQSASDRRVAKRVLAEAPAEVIEQMIDELPKERQQQVAAAAGHVWAKARVEHDERERNLTPVERKERETNASTIETFGALITTPFRGQRIVEHIEMAIDDLKVLIEHDTITPEISNEIGVALGKLNNEFEVAKAMRSLDEVEL